MHYCSVVPREVIEAEGDDFRKRPVGTGPFYFKYWKEGVKLVLLRNPNYFEKDEKGQSYPYLDAVNIGFIIDKQSAFLEFVKGKLDFISGLDASYKDEVLSRSGKLSSKYSGKFYMLTQPYLNVEYLGIFVDSKAESTSSGILRIKKVRQAINYGFDRSKMLRYMRNNIGTPGIYGMIPPGLPSFINDTIYDYRPELASRLLEEAGYPEGKGLPEIRLTTTSSYLDLCIYIQHELQQIGIILKVETSPPASLREMVAQGKIPFFRASWIADYPDAENYLSLFYSANFSPDGPNYTHFSALEFDELYRKSVRQTNDSLRNTIYQTMNKIVMEESPVVILYYDQVVRFIQNNISGLGSNPLNLLSLKKVRKQ
jgi:peptide/nickel transport system substrate-binding protein